MHVLVEMSIMKAYTCKLNYISSKVGLETSVLLTKLSSINANISYF